MLDEHNKRNTKGGGAQPDPHLVNTVAAVIQALQNSQNGAEPTGKKFQNSETAPKTIDLIGLIFHVLEKFWIVLLAAIVCASMMGYSASRSVPMYTATSKLYIVDPDNTGINMADLQIGNALTMDYQEIFKTWEVHEMVREELELPYSYEYMQHLIHVTNPEDTRVLYIAVTFPNAQMAADIANAYARAAKEFIINTMRTEMPSDFSIALVPGVGQVVSRTGQLIKGFLLGSVLSVGVLTLLFVLDDRPRTPEDIGMYGDIPTLAVLPSTKETRRNVRKKHRRRRSGGLRL